MKHPQHDLLIAAANDVDARFTCLDWNNSPQEIQTVLNYSKYNWKLVDKPVYEWQWLVKSSDGYLTLTNYHYENAEQCKNAHHNSATILYRIEESKREVKS